MVNKCTFCGSELGRGTGTMYVRNDGKVYYFCSRKCEKALLVRGNEARRYKWTAAYQRGGIRAHGPGKAKAPAPAAQPAAPAQHHAPAPHPAHAPAHAASK